MRCPDLLATQSCVTKVLDSIAHAVYRSTNQLRPARQLQCYRKREDFFEHLSRSISLQMLREFLPSFLTCQRLDTHYPNSGGSVINSSFEFAKMAIRSA